MWIWTVARLVLAALEATLATVSAPTFLYLTVVLASIESVPPSAPSATRVGEMFVPRTVSVLPAESALNTTATFGTGREPIFRRSRMTVSASRPVMLTFTPTLLE